MRIMSPRGTVGMVGKMSRHSRSPMRAAFDLIAAAGIPLLLLIGIRQFFLG